jgi:glutamate dehydrogenase/leucine dehydrogenase
MVPQNVQRSPSTFSGKDARILQYQDVLANLSSSNKTDPSLDSSAENTLQDAVEWPSDDEDDEIMKGYRVNKPDKTGPLLGGFADIGASMK